MKKILLLFGAAVLALTSCTNDKTDSATTSGLIKKMTIDGYSMSFTYDGMKLVKIEGSDSSISYTYTGDLITMESSVDSENDINNKFISNTEYTYENGILKSDLNKLNDGSGGSTMENGFSHEYIYNTDGTITVKGYTYNNDEPMLGRTSIYTFQNGNLIKEERFDSSGVKYGVNTYEYDNKINPFKNITGYNKMYPASLSVNNAVKTTQIWGPDNDKSTLVTTSVYTYTSDGYPLTNKSTTVVSSGTDAPQTDTSSVQYEY